MKLSAIGEKLTEESGILSLMNDLGNALAERPELIMMGGGNPAYIPEVEQTVHKHLNKILNDPVKFRRLTGTYASPQGDKFFIKALTEYLNKEFSWPISEKNIMLTNGSQCAFFMLFNLLAGRNNQGDLQQIQLPLVPEYIGYDNTGIDDNIFKANQPKIEMIDDQFFKYNIDFDNLTIDSNISALCVSRPTNPSGNVITDEEIQKLDQLAQKHNIPLIIDGAYGLPFPGLIYNQATTYWSPNTITCLSLSKLGLPATRTGIVIADEKIINALSSMNAIISLAPNSFGSVLMTSLLQSNEIPRLTNQVIRPFYAERSLEVVNYLQEKFKNLPLKIHAPQGSIFLWLWFKGLPVSSLELYNRLKQKDLLIVSGHYFFPGLDTPWDHQDECIRMTYTQDMTKVRKGIDILAEEIKSLY